MKIVKSLIKILPVMLLLSACAGVGDETMPEQLPLRVLFSSTNCTATEQAPSLAILSSQRQWQETMKQLGKISGHTESSIKVEFAHEQVLQINMGQKTTGGYSLNLIEGESNIQHGWAQIHLQWNKPAAGMMVTMALTSPCVMLALPRYDYQGFRVFDQSGQLRLEKALQ